MNKFPNTYILSRLNHEDKENLNQPSMNKEIESVIKISPSKKNPRTGGFTA
jgi:hypothetical protein